MVCGQLGTLHLLLASGERMETNHYPYYTATLIMALSSQDSSKVLCTSGELELSSSR
jgi:hypothetical protein